jgi:hypothetical protein
MSLKAQLTDDMKTAMKAGEKDRLGVIRLVLAAIKQKEVDERIEMTDPLVLAVGEDGQAAQVRSPSTKPPADLAVIGAWVIDLPAGNGRSGDLADRLGHRHHRRGGPGGHGQADGRAQAATGRPGRHGPGLGAGEGQAG